MKSNIYRYIKDILKIGIWVLFLPICLSSCINETFLNEPEDPEPNLTDEKITFSFKLSLTGNATRSGTDNNGSSDEDQKNSKDRPDLVYKDTYPAVKNENIINGFKLFFVSQESTFSLTSGQTLDFNEDEDTEYTKTVTISITSEELKRFAGQEFQVYFVGNITPTVETAFLTGFDPMTAKVDNIPATETSWLGVFEKDGFSMPIVSRSEFKVDLKNLNIEDIVCFEEGKGNGTDSYKVIVDRLRNVLGGAFGGVMTLERINARIDIADGSPDPDNPNMYPFFYTKKGHEEFFNAEGKCLLNLKLTRIDPITVHKQSYLFRHTAKGDNNGAIYNEATSENPGGYEISLFGDENGDVTGEYNWIIDCDAEYKREYKDIWTANSEDNTELGKHFYQSPLRRDNHALAFFEQELKAYTGMEYIKNNGKIEINHPNDESRHDNHLYKGYSYDSGAEYDNMIYYPWRYMPENTLPSVKEMIRGFSTGIRYEVVLCDEAGDPFTYDKVLEYQEKQNLPYRIELYRHNDNSNSSNDTENFNRVKITIGEETLDNIYLVGKMPETPIKQCAVRLYYFYFFRHNFNSQNPVAPKPMKYGIVRNNIYRLCMKGFNGLPRPYNFEDPDDPYDLIVDLKVLDWTKRKTAITFK